MSLYCASERRLWVSESDVSGETVPDVRAADWEFASTKLCRVLWCVWVCVRMCAAVVERLQAESQREEGKRRGNGFHRHGVLEIFVQLVSCHSRQLREFFFIFFLSLASIFFTLCIKSCCVLLNWFNVQSVDSYPISMAKAEYVCIPVVLAISSTTSSLMVGLLQMNFG